MKDIIKIVLPFLAVLLLTAQSSVAQEMSVESFTKLERDMSARTANIRDINGELCALLKIETTEKGFIFQGMVERTEQKVGEIYVFVSPGMRFITIKHNDFGMLRNYEFPQSIESGVVYHMKLLTTAKEVKIDTASIGKVVDNKLDELLAKKLSEIDLGANEQPVVITMQQIGDKGKTTNGHEYVNLGLSVKWAACNMGEKTAEKLGSYYAWGETSPKRNYSKENNTTYGKPIDVDVTSAKPKYDMARKKWKEPWRLPTSKEVQELIDSCSWQWASLNGMTGYKVTGPNGNSIFIPTSGIYSGNEVVGGGKMGAYWTANHKENDTLGASYLYIASNGYMLKDTARYYGMNIRPVLGNYNRYNFVTLNYANAFISSQSSYGISIGAVKKYIGYYATLMTNFNFVGLGNNEQITDNVIKEGFYTGKTQTSRFSANAGVLLGKPRYYLKVGAGYGFRTLLWQKADNTWGEVMSNTYKGIELNAGAMVLLGRFAVSADVVLPINHIGDYLETRIGLGFKF